MRSRSFTPDHPCSVRCGSHVPQESEAEGIIPAVPNPPAAPGPRGPSTPWSPAFAPRGSPKPGPRWAGLVHIGAAPNRGPHRIWSPITTRTPGTPNSPRNAVESNATNPKILRRTPCLYFLSPCKAPVCGPLRTEL